MEQINNRLMNWASIIEANTLAQAETTATMPFIFPHLALMPDPVRAAQGPALPQLRRRPERRLGLVGAGLVLLPRC